MKSTSEKPDLFERKFYLSEKKFKAIAETATDAIIITDQQSRIIYLNSRICQIFGYSINELTGNTLNVLMPSKYHAEHKKGVEKFIKNSVPHIIGQTIELEGKKKDGTIFPIELSLSFWKDDKEIYFSGIIRDISKRKEALERLKENRLFSQRITELSPTIISIYDLIENKSVYANKELFHLLGYSAEEVQAMGEKAMQLLVHPDDFSTVNNQYSKASELQDEEVYEREFRVRHANGGYRWFSSRTTVFKRTKTGKVSQVISTSLDITEQKTAEQNLKDLNEKLEEKVAERTRALKQASRDLEKNQNQLQVITNTLPAFIAYIDRNEIYRFGNKAYNSLSFIQTSPIGKPLKEVIGKSAYQTSKKHFQKALQGESSKFVNQLSFKDGSVKDFEIFYVPDKDDSGTITGVIVMAIDLTERINFEKKLSSKNEELKKINRDLDNFIYTASHDLKAPIANIEGLLNIVKASESYSELPEIITRTLELIDSSVEKFRDTIIDLTEISKAQKSSDEEVEIIDIGEVIADVSFLINDLIKNTGTKITTDLRVNRIRFSHKSINSLFYNLLSNAIKYRHPERSPHIIIKTKDMGKYTLLSVTDNGLGISKERQDKIFTMFKRMHTHVDGTGIGLYLVKRIVENAGGKVEVNSEPGQGSAFNIYLPA